MSALSREGPAFRLLLACCRHPLTEEDRANLAFRLREPLDWTEFLALVERHRIHPQILASLEQAGWAGVPDGVREDLARRVHLQVPQAFGLLQDLLAVVPALEAAGIPVLVLKGPPLSLQLFGDPAFRTSKDLDLLVSREAFPEALRCLEALGCVRIDPGGGMTPRQLRRLMRVAHQVAFQTPGGRHIELHFRADHEWGISGFLEEAFARPSRFPMGSVGIPVPDPEDHLLYLFVHGARHQWARLKWLCDVEACLKQGLVLDWTHWLRSVRRQRLERMVAEGLCLARTLLGVELPEPLDTFLKETLDSRWRVDASLEELLEPTDALSQGTQSLARILRTQAHRWHSRPSLPLLGIMVREPLMGADVIMAWDWPMALSPIGYLLRFPMWLFKRRGRLKGA